MKSGAFTLWTRFAGDAYLSPWEDHPNVILEFGGRAIAYFMGKTMCLAGNVDGPRWKPYYMERRGS